MPRASSRRRVRRGGMLGPGDFFGDGCLAGQQHRMSTAAALHHCTVMCVEKAAMVKARHDGGLSVILRD